MDTVLYLARLSKANIGEQAGVVGALEGRSGERRGHEEKKLRDPLMSRGVAMRVQVPLYSPSRAELSVCSSNGVELQPRTLAICPRWLTSVVEKERGEQADFLFPWTKSN